MTADAPAAIPRGEGHQVDTAQVARRAQHWQGLVAVHGDRAVAGEVLEGPITPAEAIPRSAATTCSATSVG